MKNKIFTVMAMVLAAMLMLQAVSAEAALRTKLTIVIAENSNPGSETPSHEVSPDLLDDDGVFTGSSKDVESFTDEEGRSVTRTVTEFRNVDGELLMSADVAITARSEDFTVKAGKLFSEIFSVDVTVERFDDAYDSYEYSMDITGLPAWLKAEGELISSDTLSTDITIYHHEFTLSGTAAAGSSDVTFTAVVLVSGDWPAMRAVGSKDISITAEAVPKPPEEEPTEPPDIPPGESPDIPPGESPDIPPGESPDIPPGESPDIPPGESPDIPPEESPDIPPGESPDIPPGESPDIPSGESPDIPPGESPDIPPGESPDIPPDIGPGPSDNPPDDTDNDNYLDTGDTGSISELLDNLTDEQKQEIKVLKIDGDMTDLAGIEAFTNLETLDLTEANIGSADLRGLTNLKSVDIKGNSSITSLNLAGTEIESLNAEGCENLEELDVSGCVNLKTLDVSNTPLRTLNAENCTSLEVLNCSNCRLEELHIAGCDSLNVLDCSNNRLHKLDAYMFSRLDVLRCFNQNITGWRLSRLFSFIDYFLGRVSVSDTESTADSGVENITDLKAWDAGGNELTVNYDPGTGWAEFSGEPAKLTYNYVTGFEDTLMDVTVFAAEGEDVDVVPSIPGNSGGCNTAFELSVSVFALAFLLLRRKR